MITADERRRWNEEGWFVRAGVLQPARVEALCRRLSARIAEAARRDPPLDFWQRLRRSADTLTVFWDAERPPSPALPPERWEDHATRVGHGLHLADEEFRATAHARELAGVLAHLVPAPARLVQSAVIYKQPRSQNPQFGLHQDSWYLTSEPDTLVLAFVALDDMDLRNGCLEVVPGSHRGPLQMQLALDEQGFRPVSGADAGPPPGPAVPVPLERGSAIFLHGRTFHGSGPNRSDRRRRALILHALGGASRLAPSSWVQEPPGGFPLLGP